MPTSRGGEITQTWMPIALFIGSLLLYICIPAHESYVHISFSPSYTHTHHSGLYKKRTHFLCRIQSQSEIYEEHLNLHTHIRTHTTNICIWPYALIHIEQTTIRNIRKWLMISLHYPEAIVYVCVFKHINKHNVCTLCGSMKYVLPLLWNRKTTERLVFFI